MKYPPTHTRIIRWDRQFSPCPNDFQPAQKYPTQAVKPSGSPIPHKTILRKGKMIAGRFAHCSEGGPPPIPLDSFRATFMLSTQSGFNCTVKMVVSPAEARKLIGCVTLKVAIVENKATVINTRESPTILFKSALFEIFRSATDKKTAMNSIPAKGRRLIREERVIPRVTPKRMKSKIPLRFIW